MGLPPRDPNTMPFGAQHHRRIVKTQQSLEKRMKRAERKTTQQAASLPASPVNGQIAFVQSTAMATDGVVWKFRYNAISASAYKWEFVGGAPWHDDVGASETTTSVAYADLATVGPTVTLPLAGEYLLRLSARQDFSVITANRLIRIAPEVGSTVATDSRSVTSAHMNVIAMKQTPASEYLVTALAGDVVTVKYRVDGDTGRFDQRKLSVIPVRVS